MSNVLIGIIGVILFIGLALAGALFLGPRFQQSTNNSKASAAVQAVSQVGNAANMANVQGGTSLSAATDTPSTLVSSGFLKSIPTDPTGGTGIILVDGSLQTGSGAGSVQYAVMPLSTNASAVCAAISRQSGQVVTQDASGNDVAPSAATLPLSPSGCVLLTVGIANGPSANSYLAFARI